MKVAKYSANDTNKIDLDTKIIYKYPTPTKKVDIAKMVVKGRHPKEQNKFLLEHKCQFVIYVLSGTGKVYAGDSTFEVSPEDVVFIPVETRFAVEGDMEYITVDIPAFYSEQSEEVISN